MAEKKKILGLGEILWDMLPGGKKLGGAVTNLIYFTNLLGSEGRIASAIGTDDLGKEILAVLEGNGLSTDLIREDPDHPTGTVEVTLDQGGKPSYIIHEHVAWDNVKVTDALLASAREADALVFGSLFQRNGVSRDTLRTVVKAAENAVTFCDINLRQNYYSEDIISWSCNNADILKLNDEEIPVIGKLTGLYGDADGVAEGLIEKYSLKMIALTRGDKGSVLYTSESVSEHPGIPAEVRDSVGAGDSFAAAVLTGVLEGWDLDDINDRGNIIASYVCSQDGATPAVPAEVISNQ